MRLLLFICLLAVVAAGALLYFDMSDAEVRRAASTGADQLRKGAGEIGKAAHQTLEGATDTINEHSASLRAGTAKARGEADRAIAGKQDSLGKTRKEASQQLDRLGEKADGWSQEMRTALREFMESARQHLIRWAAWLEEEFGTS